MQIEMQKKLPTVKVRGFDGMYYEFIVGLGGRYKLTWAIKAWLDGKYELSERKEKK